ncbi:MAG: hypothetical protein KAV87_20880 [Desulfobacteraceae bacterium]|nr:hypothetical protein [Desulfobacteraceae bacterium]
MDSLDKVYISMVYIYKGMVMGLNRRFNQLGSLFLQGGRGLIRGVVFQINIVVFDFRGARGEFDAIRRGDAI